MLNWLIGPALMTGLAWATLPDLEGYRNGVILVDSPTPSCFHSRTCSKWRAVDGRLLPQWASTSSASMDAAVRLDYVHSSM